VDEIARLLGSTEDVAQAELGELVSDEPDHRAAGAGCQVPPAEYLSGKRTKLAAARAAALDDPAQRERRRAERGRSGGPDASRDHGAARAPWISSEYFVSPSTTRAAGGAP